MSWMDSWSRPAKSQATPAPYYLLPGGENTPYCHSCGRVIGPRKANAAASAKTEARYCSTRCRHQKPGRLDREIESVFVSLLNREDSLSGLVDGAGGGARKNDTKDKKGRKAKSDQRVLVPCSVVENLVFGRRHAGTDHHSQTSGTPEPETEHDEQPGRDDPVPAEAVKGLVEPVEQTYVDGDVLARMSIRSGTRIRPRQDVSEVNGSVGGEKGWAERIEESKEMSEKRRQGQKRAKEKERVKCAARRGAVFGFKVNAHGSSEKGRNVERIKLCEAVMNGKIVEPSFAKGDWCVRWREEI